MNAKTNLTAVGLILLALSGCASSAPVVQVVPCDQTMSDSNFTPTQENSALVNYTETDAEYREFGERAPRDQYITQAGAGNNISAAIPPRADDEFVDYEEEIVYENENNSEGLSDSGYNVEDPVEDWLAEEGKTLKALLTEWSEKSGWRLIWKSNRNYTLTAGAMFRGRFADVSSALIRAFARAKPAPIGTFYKGNRVLVVETLEDENAY